VGFSDDGWCNGTGMLAELLRLKRQLPDLIANPETVWNTLEVLYEPPRVERVWTQIEENRLFLHRIYPCKQGYYHPHPWPSAVTIIQGRQIMTVGVGDPRGEPPPVSTTIHLAAKSSYEMLDPRGWHAVMPQDEPSLSLMLTGRPWSTETAPHPLRAANKPLTDEVRDELLRVFKVMTV
jgi:hypothetical protein